MTHASIAGWHSCSGGLSPIIAPIQGITSSASGVADQYIRSSETYSDAPIWRGVSNGFVVYMCGGSNAAKWTFTTDAKYLADRAECKGWMVLRPSGQWQVWTGSVATGKWIDATPSISCGPNRPDPNPQLPALFSWSFEQLSWQGGSRDTCLHTRTCTGCAMSGL